LETLPLRFRQHCSNAEKVVDFLSTHKSIEKVISFLLKLKNLKDTS